MNIENIEKVTAAIAIEDEVVEAQYAVKPIKRRHDLDALRAIAMLLGIVLHAALSFAPIPWTVQDSQQSDWFYVLFAGIHGFRMPLFFMLSGFFTAMLWRKRGLFNLVFHRFMRIALPLFLGCLTIIPAMWMVSILASRPAPGTQQSSKLFEGVISGDIELVRSELKNPDVKIDQQDSNSGATPLCSAVFLGRSEIVEMLIEAKADVNVPNKTLSSPLHISAFMGRSKIATMLVNAGADVNLLDGSRLAPKDILKTDFGTTNFIASSAGVPVNEEELMAGRKEIAELLDAKDYLDNEADAARQEVDWEGLKGLFFMLPIFMHLWFLWFLCWLVAAFLIYAALAKIVNFKKIPRWLICSPISLLWLVPLTMLPQFFMVEGSFGPDSSIGLIPIPSVLCYYAIFFFFGAVYWDMDDNDGQLGRWWYLSLPLALLVVLPIGLDYVSGAFEIVPKLEDDSTAEMIGSFLQALFAWLMTFGSIGLFRKFLSGESRAMRYISDSSYWLYLVHLPLVLLLQWLVRELPISPFLKFIAISVVVSAFLLLTYEFAVRYTWIGALLNGRKTRKPKTT